MHPWSTKSSSVPTTRNWPPVATRSSRTWPTPPKCRPHGHGGPLLPISSRKCLFIEPSRAKLPGPSRRKVRARPFRKAGAWQSLEPYMSGPDEGHPGLLLACGMSFACSPFEAISGKILVLIFCAWINTQLREERPPPDAFCIQERPRKRKRVRESFLEVHVMVH